MIQHPGITIFVIWLLYALIFIALPFELLSFELTWFGYLMLSSSILFFVIGTLIVSTTPRVDSQERCVRLELGDANLVLILASSIAIIFLFLDIAGQDGLSLLASAERRELTASALTEGKPSASSIWFQLAFLFYPAGYVFIAIQTIYSKILKPHKIFLWGFLPIILATLSMGGRTPIFYAVMVLILSILQRWKIEAQDTAFHNDKRYKKILTWFVLFFLASIVFYYFVSVFFARAGDYGSEGMFEVASISWGVGFSGVFADFLFDFFGVDVTYLIFIFSWYLLQGIVIGIQIFSNYDGPLLMGIYGVDIVAALMRRLVPDFLSQGFNSLLNIGTYGFLPSAWGSLYVDFGMACLLFCFLWGVGTAICFKRINVEKNMRWFILGPFISIGIVFSIINTPLGFTNGFVTHAWLFIAFFLIRTYRTF